MQIQAIAAMSQNRIIGKDQQLPWHLPSDLKRFKALTWGQILVMGRKTFESIGRPLPGRDNWVLSHNPAFLHHSKQSSGIVTFSNWESLFIQAQRYPEKNLLIIGGATLYAQALPWVQRFYLTVIHQDFSGDCYFPTYPGIPPELGSQNSPWIFTQQERHLTPLPHTFFTLDARNPKPYPGAA